ncbi:BTE_HP_G0222020.mRNA.1.CDS.1 [Saccharomyces cerevisiae]|nr:BTE_HP_G0222020.mRNA.1.CDS.1 [Saccharomyces cerevisiae]CAI6436206.1 BTE_HP_G0222020.mRNA.1.CDS.1 [Saccharomyces cerevisiae]
MAPFRQDSILRLYTISRLIFVSILSDRANKKIKMLLKLNYLIFPSTDYAPSLVVIGSRDYYSICLRKS